MSRRTGWAGSAAVMSMLVAHVATAALAPATPTFALQWGTQGTGSGQFTGLAGVACDVSGNVYIVDPIGDRVTKFDAVGNPIFEFGGAGSADGRFDIPYGVAVDAAGNIYVSDAGNNRIQKFSSDGFFLAKWGTRGSGAGQFNWPADIALDRSGYLYVADLDNYRVQKFTDTGTFITSWGGLGAGDGRFQSVDGVAVDPSGNVFVSDGNLNRIQRFTEDGTYLAQWGGTGSAAGQFQGSYYLAADALGSVYVSDNGNHRVQKFTAAGEFVTQWGASGTGEGQFAGAEGIGVDAAGNVYVADALNYRVQKFSGAGAAGGHGAAGLLLKWGSYGSGNGQFINPRGICVDGGQYVYVTDGNNRVQKFDALGNFVKSWGTAGTGSGQFNTPYGLAAWGSRIYVVDSGNARVQVFDSQGIFQWAWGVAGGAPGEFTNPQGITVGPDGVYVADTGNDRIQHFGFDGSFISQWGTSGSAPGQFSSPARVAADRGRNVFVTDYFNHRVQKFSHTGEFISEWSGTSGHGDEPFAGPAGIVVDASGNVYVVDYILGRVQKFSSDGAFLSRWGQFTYPVAATIDAAGNVYVMDSYWSACSKLAVPPMLTQVSDVGNDQGRQALLQFTRASADAPGTGITITGYEVYRRIEGLPIGPDADGAGAATGPAFPDAGSGDMPAAGTESAGTTGTQLAGWTYLLTVPAHGESEYSVVAPTLADATPGATYYTQYMVRAATSDPFVFYDSGVQNGFSIDNLPPAMPSSFSATTSTGVTRLHWDVSTEPDFAEFRLYRGASEAFLPGAGNLVAATADTGFTDAESAGAYYKLSAVDRNGNESPYALASPTGTVDAPLPAWPGRVRLAGARPNPWRPGGAIRFALPRTTRVSLALYDVQGRRLRMLVDGEQPAGEQDVHWDGRDDGGRPVASGVLMLRLAAEGVVLTKRVVILD